MARPSNRARRREELLAALTLLLAREGWAACTVEAIAREAGLSPGLVNYHFATKQDLLLALVDRLEGRVRARAQAAAGPDPWSALDALVDACLGTGEGADPTAVAAWTALGSEAARSPEIVARYGAALLGLARSIEAAMDACAPGVPHHGRAAGVLAAVEGAYRVGATTPGTLPAGQMAGLVKADVHASLGRAAAEAAAAAVRAAAPFDVPPGLTEIVVALWSGPGRWYHDPLHLRDVLQLYAGETWSAPREVFLALLFHDAVYVPARFDNEAVSAALARATAAALVPGVDLDRVEALILLTAGHGNGGAAPDAEAARFLDLDLAILGAEPALYDRYVAGVAREYAQIPRALFDAGRAAFLDRLLAAPRLFHTEPYERRLGRPARANLARERATIAGRA